MPHGYTGRILHVDLTQRTLEIEQPPESFYRTYLGGSAVGAATPSAVDSSRPR